MRVPSWAFGDAKTALDKPPSQRSRYEHHLLDLFRIYQAAAKQNHKDTK
ncbi:MAG: hypothetical protein LKJ47_04955 [Bifidobacteriaceae bacterium]|jgi:hypothetical protein|nr:hypothetical protein [Bifidobacteriaceae bacterium]